MSLLSILQTVWKAIKRIFLHLPDELKHVIALSQSAIQNVKNYVDSPGIDVLTALIPGDADNQLVAFARGVLADLLLALTYLSAADFPSQNDAVRAAVVKINGAPVDVKEIAYHGLASKLSAKLSDGALPWSEATGQMEYFHTHVAVKKADPVVSSEPVS